MGQRAETTQEAVLTLLKAQRAPLSAYDVLEALRRDGRRLAPTSVYRALTALIDNGAVHRLESRNAFVACRSAGAAHEAILSVCEECGAVEETICSSVLTALSRAAGRSGFAPSRHVIEVFGRCAACEAMVAQS